MSKSRLEIKVGLFVLTCLILLGVLMLQFSKGTTFFRKTYVVKLKAPNVGGLRTHASVLMSGIQVGTVSGTTLAPDGKSVTISLKIYSDFLIHPDAQFAIEQFGFLGDQYVAIYTTKNEGEPLKDGSEAAVDAPFNLQEAARRAAGFIDRLDGTAKKLDDAVNDVRRMVLNDQTLSNLSITVGNFRLMSEDARATVGNIGRLVRTNEMPIALAVSNLVQFSDQLTVIAESGHGIITNNGPQVSAAVSNLVNASAMITNILADVQAGHGTIGYLLKDEGMASHFSLLTSNLMVTSSNLNQLGLWRVFFPKHPKTETPSPSSPAPASHHPGK